jgi:hypothetical protein
MINRFFFALFSINFMLFSAETSLEDPKKVTESNALFNKLKYDLANDGILNNNNIRLNFNRIDLGLWPQIHLRLTGPHVASIKYWRVDIDEASDDLGTSLKEIFMDQHKALYYSLKDAEVLDINFSLQSPPTKATKIAKIKGKVVLIDLSYEEFELSPIDKMLAKSPFFKTHGIKCKEVKIDHAKKTLKMVLNDPKKFITAIQFRINDKVYSHLETSNYELVFTNRFENLLDPQAKIVILHEKGRKEEVIHFELENLPLNLK